MNLINYIKHCNFKCIKNLCIPIGILGAPFGQKGSIRFTYFNKKSSNLVDNTYVCIYKNNFFLSLLKISSIFNNIIRFEGFYEKKSVYYLNNSIVLINRNNLFINKKDDFYLIDTLNALVKTTSNFIIGYIYAFYNNKKQVIASIRTPSNLNVDIIFMKPFLKKIFLKKKVIIIDANFLIENE